MTTDWAKNTEVWIKDGLLQQDAILLLIIVYTNGVVCGFGSNKLCQPVICCIVNYSDELLRKDFVKFCLDFIPTINSECSTSIINHLMKTVGMTATDANDEIKRFELQIDDKFWEKAMAPLLQPKQYMMI